MPSPFSVTIKMSPDTVKQLKAEGSSLYGFKAVKSAQKSGAPLVWFVDSELLTTVRVNWSETYQAYNSTSQIITNGEIDSSNSIDIDLGQTANVDTDGNLSVTENGTPDAISINNLSTTPFTCGISQMQAGVMTPLCAFPLHGLNLDVIAPIEKVLLMFASAGVNTGTVIEQAFASGVLLDLTANPQVSVKYDIDAGWDFGGQAFGTPVAANDQLLPFLITPPNTSHQKRVA